MPLLNGEDLARGNHGAPPPSSQILQIIAKDDRRDRLDPTRRLPRQMQQYGLLVDYILTVKDAPHLRNALDAHFRRIERYHARFLT